MIIKTTIAALGLLGSLTAGLAVSADAPTEPGAQTRVDASWEKPAPAGATEAPDDAGSSAGATVTVEASIR